MDKAAIKKKATEIVEEMNCLADSYVVRPEWVKIRMHELFWEFLRLQKELRGGA